MKTALLAAAVLASACVTTGPVLRAKEDVAGDLGFRLDERTCECRNAQGKLGYNPGFVGECGLLGNDHVTDPDQPAQASWVNLSDADLSNKNLRGALLRGAFLSRANFSHADLTCADLQWSYLKGTRFDGATLRSATLRRAWLQKTNLERADLRGAYVDGFAKGLDLSTNSLADATVDAATHLAKALKPLASGSVRVAERE